MELPNIGKRCAEKTCKQLDFLPVPCKCGQTFCSEHFAGHVAECPSQVTERQCVPGKAHGAHRCSHPGCKETSIVELICEKCKKHYCIAHRHINECAPEDPAARAEAVERMKAPVERFNEAKMIVDRQIDQTIMNAKKKAKNAEMAKKIQLMRVKNKATGPKSVPSTDRVYFNVVRPEKLGAKTDAVFVSRTWTVGRCIDAIAEECKVANCNNQKDATKLRLFRSENGAIVADAMGECLNDLLCSDRIVDGESLVLEYVDDGCKAISVAK